MTLEEKLEEFLIRHANDIAIEIKSKLTYGERDKAEYYIRSLSKKIKERLTC